jgi:hypothetical protein
MPKKCGERFGVLQPKCLPHIFGILSVSVTQMVRSDPRHARSGNENKAEIKPERLG